MKKILTKRTCCLLLLAAMLSSCGGGEANETETQAAATETEAVETEIQYTGEVADWGGYTFTFLNQEDVFWTGSNHILDYEGITGDGLSDAIYTRNRDAEDKLNIKMEVIKGSLGATNDMRTLMNQAIAAMEDIYDVVYLPLNHAGKTSFDGTSTINLHTINSLQLSEKWWNQSFIETATIGDNLLYTTIDYVNLMGYAYCNSFIFNRGMCRDYGMEFPYDLARNGGWTYDAMNVMITNVASLGTQTNWKPDFSGDAVYGFASQHSAATTTVLQGAGVPLIIKDSDNIPMINPDINSLVDAYDALLNIFSLDGNCLLVNKPNTNEMQGLDYFLTDRALFYSGALGETSSSRYRESEAEYGILPVPKADESQTDYCSTLSLYTFGMNIPLTAADPERTGAIMDYLAFASWKDVLPVLQTNMCYKGISDPNDIEMMNILLENQTVDLGQIYDWTSSFLLDLCGDKMLNGNNTFASGWASLTTKIQADIEKSFEEIK